MGSTSMVFSGTCTCGCRSSSFTTSSSESACRIEYPATSTSLSTTCEPSRCRPAPSGMPRSTTASPASFAQAIQASMPAWVCAGSPAAICSSAENGDRYRTMNLAMSSPSLQLARHVLPASSYHGGKRGQLVFGTLLAPLRLFHAVEEGPLLGQHEAGTVRLRD